MLQEKFEFDRLIFFSQGLSPNVELLSKLYDFKGILFVTSVSETNTSNARRDRYEKFKAMGAQFLNFQEELLDTTLIRVIARYHRCDQFCSWSISVCHEEQLECDNLGA
jgi:hypothetical protein